MNPGLKTHDIFTTSYCTYSSDEGLLVYDSSTIVEPGRAGTRMSGADREATRTVYGALVVFEIAMYIWVYRCNPRKPGR